MDDFRTDMGDNDDDWEYEYAEDETETIYVTLDLSNHTPPAPDTSDSVAPRPAGDAEDETTVIVDGSNALPGAVKAADPPNNGRLQILDLHTDNPLVTFNGQFYSCYWATDIGTSLYMTPSSAHKSDDQKDAPLRSYSSFDLLGKTRARIVGIPATLKPANAPKSSQRPPLPIPKHIPVAGEPSFSEADEEAASGYRHFTTGEGDELFYADDNAIRISVPPNSTEAKRSQARFLEAWSELRAERGRTDYVPVKAVRNYRLPEGWEAERTEWLGRARAEREAEEEAAALARKMDPAGAGAAAAAAGTMLASGLRRLRRRRAKRTVGGAGVLAPPKRSAPGIRGRVGRPKKTVTFEAGPSSVAVPATPTTVSDRDDDDDGGGEEDQEIEDDEDDEDEMDYDAAENDGHGEIADADIL